MTQILWDAHGGPNCDSHGQVSAENPTKKFVKGGAGSHYEDTRHRWEWLRFIKKLQFRTVREVANRSEGEDRSLAKQQKQTEEPVEITWGGLFSV